jgi:hypothetical protein
MLTTGRLEGVEVGSRGICTPGGRGPPEDPLDVLAQGPEQMLLDLVVRPAQSSGQFITTHVRVALADHD